MKKPKMLVIEWQDTCSDDSWMCAHESRQMTPINAISVGWVVRENKKYVVLTSMIAGGDTTSLRQCIPAGCIVSKREII